MIRDRIYFRTMAVVHETLYGLFKDPYEPLRVAGLRPGQRVLEVGCGPGFFTVPASEIVGPEGEVTSLDVSPTAVAHVRRKVAEAGATNVKVIHANAGDTQLPAQRFDLAFLFGIGRVVGDVEEIWVELNRLLKPGGTLVIEGRLRPPASLYEPRDRQSRIKRYTKLG